MRYGEFVVNTIKQERDASVCCAQCKEPITGVPVRKQYFDGRMTDVALFCSEQHHQSWYINRLNQMGL